MPTLTAGKRPSTSPPRREAGFTYIMALVAIVVVGIFAGVANLATSRIMQAEREDELLFRGQAYRDAIRHYYEAEGHYPRALAELLKDPHFAHRVYLRALYVDPMASDDERKQSGGWRLMRAADGGIAGVASRSRQAPLKQANFPLGFESFEQAKRYADWIFEYQPQVPSGAAGLPGTPAPSAGPFK